MTSCFFKCWIKENYNSLKPILDINQLVWLYKWSIFVSRLCVRLSFHTFKDLFEITEATRTYLGSNVALVG